MRLDIDFYSNLTQQDEDDVLEIYPGSSDAAGCIAAAVAKRAFHRVPGGDTFFEFHWARVLVDRKDEMRVCVDYPGDADPDWCEFSARVIDEDVDEKAVHLAACAVCGSPLCVDDAIRGELVELSYTLCRECADRDDVHKCDECGGLFHDDDLADMTRGRRVCVGAGRCADEWCRPLGCDLYEDREDFDDAISAAIKAALKYPWPSPSDGVVVTPDGRTVALDDLAGFMDREIADELHGEIDDTGVFAAAYADAHRAIFGEEWTF